MYKTILHATDLNEAHFPISEKAAKLAKTLGAKLYLLHVIELPTSVMLAQSLGFAELAKPSTEEAVLVMKTLGEALDLPKDQQFVEIGRVSEVIVKKITELGCDLVLIGSHQPDEIKHYLGSSANATIHHSPCDVITVKDF